MIGRKKEIALLNSLIWIIRPLPIYIWSFGGVAKYLSFLDPKQSSYANIDRLFFSIHGSMYREYDELFRSLFDDKEGYYKSIIEILCTKKSGFSLSQIAKKSNKKLGQKLKTAIAELEECGFIKGLARFGNSLYEI